MFYAKVPLPYFLVLAKLPTVIFFLFTFTLASVTIAAAGAPETHHGIQEQVPIGQQREAEKPGEVTLTPTGGVVETTAVDLIMEQSPATFNPSGCFKLPQSVPSIDICRPISCRRSVDTFTEN